MYWLRYLAAAIGTLLAVAALAQEPAGSMLVRGTVTALEGERLQVKSRSGEELSIAFPPGTIVAGMTRQTLADIKSGDFVGVTSVTGGDGKMHALEVHTIAPCRCPNPEALRGKGEGQYASDLVPNSTMTKGTTIATTADTITVNHKGETSEIMVSEKTPIVGYVVVRGDVSLLKPGAAVVVVVQKKADGGLVAMRVGAEKDGVRPPD
jgi:hypothetical protein